MHSEMDSLRLSLSSDFHLMANQKGNSKFQNLREHLRLHPFANGLNADFSLQLLQLSSFTFKWIRFKDSLQFFQGAKLLTPVGKKVFS